MERLFRTVAAAGAGLFVALVGCQRAEPLPNVVFVLADDLGWGDVGVYHTDATGKPPVIPTPHLDALARTGMRFLDAHAPAAVCAPSRFSALTGSNPYRSRTWGTWHTAQSSALMEGQRHRTVGEVLQAAGYRTAFVGKMHLGADFLDGDGHVYRGRDLAAVDFRRGFENGLREHGFDYTFVSPDGIQGPLYLWFENDRWAPLHELAARVPGLSAPAPSRLRPFAPDDPDLLAGTIVARAFGDSNWDPRAAGPLLSHMAVAFIEDHVRQNPGRPFALYYASQALHWPRTPPAEFEPGVPVAGVTGLSSRTDMVYELDLQLGRILSALEKAAIADRTLVIVTSDNGGWGYEPSLPESDLRRELEAGHDPNGGLRGRKATLWEGGHRVPFIARWGDGSEAGSCIAPGSVSRELIGIHDWVATMYDLTGQDMEPDQAMDAVSLLPVLLGVRGGGRPLREFLILQGGGASGGLVPMGRVRSRGIRHRDWMLMIDPTGSAYELYDLASDPHQTNNRIDQPEDQRRVRRFLAHFRRYGARGAPRSTAPFDAEYRTPIPARCRGAA